MGFGLFWNDNSHCLLWQPWSRLMRRRTRGEPEEGAGLFWGQRGFRIYKVFLALKQLTPPKYQRLTSNCEISWTPRGKQFNIKSGSCRLVASVCRKGSFIFGILTPLLSSFHLAAPSKACPFVAESGFAESGNAIVSVLIGAEKGFNENRMFNVNNL